MANRIQINASSVVGVDACKESWSREAVVKAVLRREDDGTYTVIEIDQYTWTPTSKAERECIAAGCFGCYNCQG